MTQLLRLLDSLEVAYLPSEVCKILCSSPRNGVCLAIFSSALFFFREEKIAKLVPNDSEGGDWQTQCQWSQAGILELSLEDITRLHRRMKKRFKECEFEKAERRKRRDAEGYAEKLLIGRELFERMVGR